MKVRIVQHPIYPDFVALQESANNYWGHRIMERQDHWVGHNPATAVCMTREKANSIIDAHSDWEAEEE